MKRSSELRMLSSFRFRLQLLTGRQGVEKGGKVQVVCRYLASQLVSPPEPGILRHTMKVCAEAYQVVLSRIGRVCFN